MYILGISCFYHDSAACLLKNGKIVAAAEEERFSRNKHDESFPNNAINYCLEEGNIKVNDLEYVAFYEKPFLKFKRIIESHVSTFPKSYKSFLKSFPIWLKKKLYLKKIIRDKLDYKGRIVFPEHHISHAASSFLVSPFKKAAILTIDATGEETTTTKGVGIKNEIRLTHEIKFPHSIGLLYSTFTAHLGFKVNGGEGKVMGMAPYGEPVYYDEIMNKLIDVREDGSFKLNMDYFSYHYTDRMYKDKFLDLFGEPREKDRDDFDERHANLAASIQKVTEEILMKIVNELYEETKMKNLCLSGGVVLNCAANGKIERNSSFKNIFIQGAAGDDGGALGVAFYTYNTLLGNKRKFVMDNLYWGPSYSNEEIESFLEKNGILHTKYNRERLLEVVAEEISNKKIVGWFQGRMEFGPRALGNRSILADPRKKEICDIVNKNIKFRESFRPFAPTILKERGNDYLEKCYESPFMIRTYRVKSNRIPAVTHVDGTVRPQILKRNENPKYYDLIKKFEKKTGVGALLNTSFNRRGEPIVCSPEDAYNCFKGSKLDLLVLENYLIPK